MRVPFSRNFENLPKMPSWKSLLKDLSHIDGVDIMDCHDKHSMWCENSLFGFGPHFLVCYTTMFICKCVVLFSMTFVALKLGLPLVPIFADNTTQGDKLLQGVNFASAASGIMGYTGLNFVRVLTISIHKRKRFKK